VKNPRKKSEVSPPFEVVLQRLLDGEDNFFDRFSFPVKNDQFRRWIKTFSEKAFDTLERLYVRHGIPPAEVLETISLFAYFGIGRSAGIPQILSNYKLREKSALAMESVAADLELCKFVFWEPGLRSSPEFVEKLRQYAKALRAAKLIRPNAYRPRDENFGNCALMLTEEFMKYTGKPLWENTGALLMLAFERNVEDPRDTIKKAVKRARQARE
jgi:hypothetical protein